MYSDAKSNEKKYTKSCTCTGWELFTVKARIETSSSSFDPDDLAVERLNIYFCVASNFHEGQYL